MASKKGLTPPEVFARECIAARLRLINRVVTSIYDDALRPYGFKVSQMNILAVVALLGGAQSADVCKVLNLEKSTLSRNMNRMKAKGWLEATTKGDKRFHRLRVTQKGRKILEEAFPGWQKAQQKVISLIGKEGVASIDRISRALGMKGFEA